MKSTTERLIERIDDKTGWNYIMEVVNHIENLDHSRYHYMWPDYENEDQLRFNFMGYTVEIEGHWCRILVRLELDPAEWIVNEQGKSKKEAVIKALRKFSEYVSTRGYVG